MAFWRRTDTWSPTPVRTDAHTTIHPHPQQHQPQQKDSGSGYEADSLWNSIERLLDSQLRSIESQSQRLDALTHTLLKHEEKKYTTESERSGNLVAEVQECFDKGIDRVRAIMAVHKGLGAGGWYSPSEPHLTARDQNSGKMDHDQSENGDDLGSPTLALGISLDELIDMRVYETDTVGSLPTPTPTPILPLPPIGPVSMVMISQGLNEDRSDYETMSLSSEVDRLPSEYERSPFRSLSPELSSFPFLRAETPQIPPDITLETIPVRDLRARSTRRSDYVNHPMDSETAKKRKLKHQARDRGSESDHSTRPRARSRSASNVSSILVDTHPSTASHPEPSESDSEEDRSIRGLSTAEVLVLPISDGEWKEDGKKWWAKGPNTWQNIIVSVSLGEPAGIDEARSTVKADHNSQREIACELVS